MSEALKNDKRIHGILSCLNKFSEGDYGQNIHIPDQLDEIDAISSALNQLGDALRVRDIAIIQKDEKINALLEIVQRYRAMDFSQSAQVGEEKNEMDTLAAGLNALGEKVQHHTTRLKNSEEQLDTIFKNAPDAVIVINSKGLIVRWNPAAFRIFGWEEDEVAGKFLHDILIPERYHERHLAGMARFLKKGEGPILNKTVELPALRKDNSEIDIELTISPAKLNEDYLFISFLRDITERKKNEEQIRLLNATLEQRVLERTEQLKLSENKYRNLFENNPIPLWLLDIQSLRFMDVNESAISLYGYSREEFLSMTAVDIRPEEERERYLKLNRGEIGTQNTGVWKHRKKDGTLIYSEVIVHEITFEGKPARMVLANDVTEKTKALQALQHSEARFRRIFDSKMIGFLFWDTNGEVTEANDPFLEMIGYTRKDLESGKILLHEMTPPEYVDADKLAMEQIALTGVCEPFEKEYIRKDGRRLPVMLGAAAIDNSTTVKGVAFVMDISQRKKMEQEILELNKGLETRIAERTQELQLVNKELESFSYSVSHDLRAPLRAIHGFSQMLTEDYEAKLGTEGIRLLNAVKFNAKRMGQLVDDLLSFSRMGKTAFDETSADIDRLVKDIIEDLSPEERERTKITVHPLGNVRADETLLRQAFQNLILNSIKYSSKKDKPEVEIGRKEINGKSTYFVKDNGAGFNMAYYNKLFGVFQRLHDQDEFEGTGVGLAIVQRIIDRHGGKIWAEAKVNEGATFYFTLS